MKLGPVTKLDKRNKTTTRKIDDGFILTNCDVIVIFRFLANLRQFGSRIADAYSIEVTFLLTATFYLTQTENRTKKSYTTFP